MPPLLHAHSLPAVQDLRECLANTSLHTKLVRMFGSATQARLLQPGAATSDIIQQYVSTIRALQQIDPSGADLAWAFCWQLTAM